MARERVIPRLVVTLPLSLLLHGGVVMVIAARGGADGAARLSPDAVIPTNQPPDDPRLGLDKELPSSVDWVGYDEYREHVARFAETEQAALTDKPPPGAEAPSPVAPPMEPAKTVAESPQDPAEASSSRSAGSQVEPDQARERELLAEPAAEVTSSPEAMPIPSPESERPDVEIISPTDMMHVSPLLGPVIERIEEMIRAAPRAPKDSPETAEDQGASPRIPEGPASHEPVSPQPPAEAGQSVEPHKETGDVTDRQSDATSRLDVTRDQWQMGKPLAGKGVELKPRRADVPLFTRFTATLRANPVCRMEFDRTGRVVRAMILIPSGDPRVDENILNSLYSWRATGEAIDSLVDEAVYAVELRYVLISAR